MQIGCLMEMSTNIKVKIWCCRSFRSSFTYKKGKIYDCMVGCDNFFPLLLSQHFLKCIIFVILFKKDKSQESISVLTFFFLCGKYPTCWQLNLALGCGLLFKVEEQI